MAQYRVGRLEQEFQREVTDILLKRVRDPRVEGVTVTGVEVTGDLQQATIYYSILSDKASSAEKTQQGLNKDTGLIGPGGVTLEHLQDARADLRTGLFRPLWSHIDELLNDLHRRE